MALTKISTAMISQSAAVVDLNVDAGTFYVDATNNRVGVGGKTDPDTPLHVIGTVTATTFAGSGASLTNIPNSALTNSSITINSTATNLGGSLTLTTANIAENTNLYYTNARADARIAAATTDDLSEGSSNLYYTDARVDARVSGGSLGNITTTGYIRGPSSFTIDPAAHGDNSGTVVIAGNLQVDGTTTTINSTTMTVDDKNITLASGSANAAAASGAGFTVDIGSGTNPAITYDGTNDEWDFNKNVNVTGSVTASTSMRVSDGEAYGFGDNSYRIEGKDDGANARIGFITGSSERMRIDSSGRLGIGIINPTEKFTVVNASSGIVGRFTNNIDQTLDLGVIAGSGANGGVYYSSANSGYHSFQIGTSEKMRITNGGNVGIGTTAPGEKLEVNGNMFINVSSGNPNLTIKTAGAGNNPLLRLQAASTYWDIESVFSNTNDELFFKYGTSTKMAIDKLGNVGIGTTSPTSVLHVSSTPASGYPLAEISNTSNTTATSYGLSVQGGGNSGGAGYQFQTKDMSGNVDFFIRGDGNVGIGTTAPIAPLHVAGNAVIETGSPDLYLATTSASHTNWRIAAQEVVNQGFEIASGTTSAGSNAVNDTYTTRFVIKSDGNVGIGNTAPTSYSGYKILHLGSAASGGQGLLKFGTGATANGPELYAPSSGNRLHLNTSGAVNVLNLVNSNVGIGTTAPNAPLHVNPGTNFSKPSLIIDSPSGYSEGDLYVLHGRDVNTGIGFSATGFGVNIQEEIPSDNIPQLRSNTGGLTSAGLMYVGADEVAQGVFGVMGATGSAGTDLEHLFTVRSSGNVGIGTTSPGSLLTVHNSSTAGNTELHVHNNKSGDAAVLKLEGKRSSLNDTGQLIFANNGNLVAKIDARSAADDGELRFFTSASGSGSTMTQRMLISSSGNVGIGTSSAYTGAKLSVAGSTVLANGNQFVIGTFGTSGLQLIGNAGGDNVVGTMGSSEPLLFRTGSTERMRIDSSGNVGLGVTPNANWSSSYRAIDAFGGATFQFEANSTRQGQNFYGYPWKYKATRTASSIAHTSTGDISMQTAPSGSADAAITWTSRLHIKNTGNVGIGTTSPGHKLDVAGTTNITSSTSMLLTLNPTANNYGGILYQYGGATKGAAIYNAGMMVYGGESNVSTVLQAGGQYGLFIHHSTRWVGIGMSNSTPTSVLNVRGDGGGTGLTFKTEDASANETFYVQDGGRAGLNYWPLTVGIPSGTAAATNAKFQVEEAGLLTVLTNGNVGIGTTSPGATLHTVANAGTTGLLVAGAASNNVVHFANSSGVESFVVNADGKTKLRRSGSAGTVQMFEFGASQVGGIQVQSTGLGLGGAARENDLFIKTDGNVLVRTTATPSASQAGFMFSSDQLYTATTSTSANTQVRFYNGNGLVGHITTNGSATAFNTSSDQRLKDNIVDAPSASDDIDAIQVRSFDWKADGSHQKYGMVAQELQSVAPEAVSGDADSDDMMSIDYSKLVPMLVKEIQSLRARVAELEGE